MNRSPETMGVPFDYTLVMSSLFGSDDQENMTGFTSYRDMMKYRRGADTQAEEKIREPITTEELDF